MSVYSMAKLKALAMATLLLFAAVAADTTGEHGRRCRRLIWRRDVVECKRFLGHRCRWTPGRSCRHHLDECCWELERLGRRCQCDGVRLALSESGELHGWEMEELVRKASNLPALCGMGIGRCYIPRVLGVDT